MDKANCPAPPGPSLRKITLNHSQGRVYWRMFLVDNWVCFQLCFHGSDSSGHITPSRQCPSGLHTYLEDTVSTALPTPSKIVVEETGDVVCEGLCRMPVTQACDECQLGAELSPADEHKGGRMGTGDKS